MKTIFISVFEGVEAKNILRTKIIPTLLQDEEVRLVLLMKSQERASLYEKEFSNPRMIYEVVPYTRTLGRGFDRVFANLKFTLLRTKSTNLQRKRLKEKGKRGAFVLGHIANFLLARKTVRKIARVLDFWIVKNTIYAPVFDKYRPDLVFLAHLFEEPEIHILREARRRKIPSIGFMNSWDKITERCILRLLPDDAIVFNEIMKKELIQLNEMPKNHIFVSGIPQYDEYSTGDFSSREDFFKKINSDTQKKLLVYATNIPLYTESDWETIDLLHRLNEEGKFGEKINILVRFRPTDELNREELAKRPWLHYDYPGTRLSEKTGVDWDMDEDEARHLRETLRYMDVLVSYSSSITVDAAIFNKPIININFDPRKNAEEVRFYNYTKDHYARALKSGGIRLVHSEQELVEWVRKYLSNPKLDEEGRKRLVQEQCQFLDGKSGERIGKYILERLK